MWASCNPVDRQQKKEAHDASQFYQLNIFHEILCPTGILPNQTSWNRSGHSMSLTPNLSREYRYSLLLLTIGDVSTHEPRPFPTRIFSIGIPDFLQRRPVCITLTAIVVLSCPSPGKKEHSRQTTTLWPSGNSSAHKSYRLIPNRNWHASVVQMEEKFVLYAIRSELWMHPAPSKIGQKRRVGKCYLDFLLFCKEILLLPERHGDTTQSSSQPTRNNFHSEARPSSRKFAFFSKHNSPNRTFVEIIGFRRSISWLSTSETDQGPNFQDAQRGVMRVVLNAVYGV